METIKFDYAGVRYTAQVRRDIKALGGDRIEVSDFEPKLPTGQEIVTFNRGEDGLLHFSLDPNHWGLYKCMVGALYVDVIRGG